MAIKLREPTLVSPRKQRKRRASDSDINKQLYSHAKKAKIVSTRYSIVEVSQVEDLVSPGNIGNRPTSSSIYHRRSIGGAKSAQFHQGRTQSDISANPKQRYTAASSRSGDESPRAIPDTTEIEDPLPESSVQGGILTPLTRQALRQLNKANGISDPGMSSTVPTDAKSESSEFHPPDEPKCAINAYHANYARALTYHGIYFADWTPDLWPSNLKGVQDAISAKRDSPEPDDKMAALLRFVMHESRSESATVASILPKIIPLAEIESDMVYAHSTSEQLWRRKIMIEPDKHISVTTLNPDRAIGWKTQVFDYPDALKVIEPWMCPVASNTDFAWPLFTIEVKGDKGNLKVARLQNLHNGATMLSNLIQLRKLSKADLNDDFFGKIHVMSLELSAESVQLSGYWAIRDASGGIKYYGMRIRTWTLYEGSHYRKAHRGTRNALDWVKAQAFGWIHTAMRAFPSRAAPTPPSTQSDNSNGKRPRSDTSASRDSSIPRKSPQIRKVLSASG